jgi:hypothetical protein
VSRTSFLTSRAVVDLRWATGVRVQAKVEGVNANLHQGKARHLKFARDRIVHIRIRQMIVSFG